MQPKTRNTGRVCAYQDCDLPIAPWFELCLEHNADKQSGDIDQCPGCGRYKPEGYRLCRECNAEAQSAGPKDATSKRRDKYALEENPAWDRGDANAEQFFVYILKLSDGTFYPGQTRELHERLDEHLDNRTPSTAGKDPKLVWFIRVETRDDAVWMEAELKKDLDYNEREIRRMIREFRDLLKRVDLT